MSSRSSDVAAILEQVHGSPALLGTITGAGGAAITNLTTAVPFTIDPGTRIMMQGDADFYWLPTPSTTADGQASTANVAAANNGVLTLQKIERKFCLRTVQTGVSIFAAGAFNVKVFSLI